MGLFGLFSKEKKESLDKGLGKNQNQSVFKNRKSSCWQVKRRC